MTFKKITKIFIVAFCVVCMAQLTLIQPALAKPTTSTGTKAAHPNPVKLKTAWVVGQEAFVVWYAKKQGWDKELGIDINMQIYQSGKEALQDFTVNNWFIGGLGAIPTLIGATEGNLSVIGIANNEAKANAIMVKPNSPMLAQKGANPDYPNVYGSANSVKGKSILATKASSAHYTVSMWLKALALTDKEAEIKDTPQDITIISYEHDKADAAALWAPYTFEGEKNGWKTIATARDVNAELPIFIVVNTAFSEQHPNVTKNFLAIYMRGIKWILSAPRKEVVGELQTYYKEVLRQDYTDAIVNLQFDTVEVFNLNAQKKLLAVTDEESTARKWQNDITDFFVSEGLLSKNDLKKISGSKYITPYFIDMITAKEIK